VSRFYILLRFEEMIKPIGVLRSQVFHHMKKKLDKAGNYLVFDFLLKYFRG
jgi:predicted DNA-binding transcriptional regulator AlpA